MCPTAAAWLPILSTVVIGAILIFGTAVCANIRYEVTPVFVHITPGIETVRWFEPSWPDGIDSQMRLGTFYRFMHNLTIPGFWIGFVISLGLVWDLARRINPNRSQIILELVLITYAAYLLLLSISFFMPAWVCGEKIR